MTEVAAAVNAMAAAHKERMAQAAQRIAELEANAAAVAAAHEFLVEDPLAAVKAKDVGRSRVAEGAIRASLVVARYAYDGEIPADGDRETEEILAFAVGCRQLLLLCPSFTIAAKDIRRAHGKHSGYPRALVVPRTDDGDVATDSDRTAEHVQIVLLFSQELLPFAKPEWLRELLRLCGSDRP